MALRLLRVCSMRSTRLQALDYQCIDAARALALIERAREQGRPYSLFDTRDAQSFARGRIASARHLPAREVRTVAAKLSREQPVLIYCYHGHSSQSFAERFAGYGFREVYSVDGGFPALARALDSQHATPLRDGGQHDHAGA